MRNRPFEYFLEKLDEAMAQEKLNSNNRFKAMNILKRFRFRKFLFITIPEFQI
jgi:hypothetical protein